VDRVPPQRRDLTRAEVVTRALALVDAGGLAACTVRGLAAELGVTPMAIYWHVPGKEDLFTAVLDAVLAEIPIDGLPPDPFESLATGARRYREAFVRHPNAAPLLARHPMPVGAVALGIMAMMLDLLAAAGLDETERTCEYLLLAQFVMGSVLTEHDVELPDGLGGRPVPPAADRFEFGLSCVLAGLRARAAP
jgi:AcrR family transcriptional regulator